MSETTSDELNASADVLREILKWIKVTSIPSVKKLLIETLDDDKSKLAYYYSDGRTSRDVASAAGCGQSTVVSYWKRWFRNGLVEPIGVQRGDRYKRVFKLEDFGISAPSPGKPADVPSQEVVQVGQ